MTVIYPRFLGVDGSGDFVWELADGRWTWGDDPHDAACKARTFEPERYVSKYGRPIGLTETIDRKAEADEDPAELVKKCLGEVPELADLFEPEQASPPDQTDRKALVSNVLYALMVNLDGWIQGAQENHEALGHRGENRGAECWRSFAPSDIRNMINDVAREFEVGEFPLPEKPREDSKE